MTLKHAVLITLMFTIRLHGVSQQAQKSNPILFAEVLVGHSWGQAGGFSGGAAMNFQSRRSLFTLRFIGTTKIHSKVISPFLPTVISFAMGWTSVFRLPIQKLIGIVEDENKI